MFKPCFICGYDVEIEFDLPNECVICEDCKSVILEMKNKAWRKTQNSTNNETPREYIIKFTDDEGKISYLAGVPHLTKYISPREIADKIKFVFNESIAHRYNRTRVRKICESIAELQKMGLYTSIIKAEGIKDGKVISFYNYKKENEECTK